MGVHQRYRYRIVVLASNILRVIAMAKPIRVPPKSMGIFTWDLFMSKIWPLAQILLYENLSASGRHLCVEVINHWSDFAAKLTELYHEYKVPRRGLYKSVADYVMQDTYVAYGIPHLLLMVTINCARRKVDPDLMVDAKCQALEHKIDSALRVAALLKATHRDWSPARIKSAMMTTSYVVDHNGKQLVDDSTGDLATVLHYGLGHINPDGNGNVPREFGGCSMRFQGSGNTRT
ncbi:hypothetical protein IFM89_001392 [Coptis chinensis]|uniref:Uncharacterized protein n=1 Tax=Coptis chinensis TaxID=261450 RepID=A0A835HTM9_9MAGN|nr:hypothetical protein IFM89_001392 [Coptis chinensis]